MDTSKEYIKMCEKAKIEVQRSKVYTDLHCGDYYKGMGGKVRICVEARKFLDKAVWMPRQDQLQDMVKNLNGWGLVGLLNFTAFHGIKTQDYYLDTFTSMEQLWLAFVMKEKFGKYWNGEDWEVVK